MSLHRQRDIAWALFVPAKKCICQFIWCMVLGLKQPVALGISYAVLAWGFMQHRTPEPQQTLLCWQKLHVSNFIFFKNSWNSENGHPALPLSFWLLMLCRRFGDGLDCLSVCYILTRNGVHRVNALSFRETEKSSFGFLLSPRNSFHISFIRQTSWSANSTQDTPDDSDPKVLLPAPPRSTNNSTVRPRSGCDFEGPIYDGLEVTVGWCLWRAVSRRQRVFCWVEMAGCPLSCNLWRLPAPTTLPTPTMPCSEPAGLGWIHHNSRCCSGCTISLLWHRQYLRWHRVTVLPSLRWAAVLVFSLCGPVAINSNVISSLTSIYLQS